MINVQLTSPVIGHHQEAVVVDLKGLPVLSGVSLQSLVPKELPPAPVPSIDDRQLRLRAPGVSDHQEVLKKRNTRSCFRTSESLRSPGSDSGPKEPNFSELQQVSGSF